MNISTRFVPIGASFALSLLSFSCIDGLDPLSEDVDFSVSYSEPPCPPCRSPTSTEQQQMLAEIDYIVDDSGICADIKLEMQGMIYGGDVKIRPDWGTNPNDPWGMWYYHNGSQEVHIGVQNWFNGNPWGGALGWTLAHEGYHVETRGGSESMAEYMENLCFEA